MATHLPAEFFRRGGTWFVAGLPITETEDVALDKAHAVRVEEKTCLPLFTSRENARQYASVVLGDGYDAVGFNDLQRQLQTLDAFAQSGCTHVVFDPRPEGNVFVPIGDAADALRRFLLQPPPSAN